MAYIYLVQKNSPLSKKETYIHAATDPNDTSHAYRNADEALQQLTETLFHLFHDVNSWFVVAVAWFSDAVALGARALFAVTLVIWEEEFGVSRKYLGGVASLVSKQLFSTLLLSQYPLHLRSSCSELISAGNRVVLQCLSLSLLRALSLAL